MADHVLDLKGLKCPLPALRTARALDRLAAGEGLLVRCTDPLAALDIPNLLRERGDRLLPPQGGDDPLTFRIRKG